MDTSKGPEQVINTLVDYRVLILIAVAAIGFQIGLYRGLDNPEKFDIADLIYLSGSMICAVFAFSVSKRYWGSAVFGRAYFFLGLGFVLWFLGDSTWMYNKHVLHIEPFPSIADAFYFLLYLPMIVHLVVNTRYFKRKWDIKTKTWLAVFPIVIIIIYSYLLSKQSGEYNLDFYYGLIVVAASAITLGFAIFGASVFRSSVLGTVWLLLAIGISMMTFGDIWYYYSQIFGEVEISHPSTTLYVTTYMIIAYALHKHRKVL